MNYLITNRLATSLIIEDVGIRLEAAGGASSSTLIQEQTYRASRKIKEYEQKKWIQISTRHIPQAKAPIPIWPFSAAPLPPPPAPSLPAQAPESAILSGLVSRLERLVGNLQSTTVVAGQVYASAASAAMPSAQPVSQTPKDPIFIPSTIVPDATDVSIHVETTETGIGDYDESREALKRARKR